jgi:hypothetical protein
MALRHVRCRHSIELNRRFYSIQHGIGARRKTASGASSANPESNLHYFLKVCSPFRENVHNRFIASRAARIPQSRHTLNGPGWVLSVTKKLHTPTPLPPLVENKRLRGCRHLSPNKTNSLRIGVRRESRLFAPKCTVLSAPKPF